MFGFSRIALASAMLGTSLFAGGCATGANGASAAVAEGRAVECRKCETTWVKVPNTEKGRVVRYTSRKTMACPDCKDAVANFFATGKLEHACKTCGPDAMAVCEGH